MVALRREERKSVEDGCCTQRVFAECSAERGMALGVLRCLRSVGRESLKPRLCDERIKSPILVSLIGRGSVPLRSGNVPRTRVSPNCVSAGLGIHPILFPLWEEFSWLVPALLGNFPGFFPLCFLFLRGIFPFSPLFPGGDSSGQEVSWLRLLVHFRRGSGVSSIQSLSEVKVSLSR